ncbi:AAA family ATPase [Thomasclavelia saccharogumia]|uniref:AAA family ATPase n=1 Tax=Thomasclavelia saccharogumia TaxID=341225 RepID=UPI00068CCFB7|nr:AAA family ATPase [Thomasclavelia saccharogumia]
MSKIIVYEYNKQNIDLIVEELGKKGYGFMAMPLTDNISNDVKGTPGAVKGLMVDVSNLYADDERALLYTKIVESLINQIQKSQMESQLFIIINRKYSQNIKDLLFYKLEKIISLEETFKLDIPINKNVVDLEEIDFENLLFKINKELVGHQKFKIMLEEELRKFRIFNKLGYQPIFSTFIVGNSGIGKTELARVMHRNLSASEHFIKINFGNYSDQNALSSLIGSPRGYIGSSKGELSDKLANSKSTVILIDEFEKSNKPVQNFFLQLLEDGVFTDSLGREYDLNKYIIIFTANVSKEKVTKSFAPELLSRFNLKYSFSNLNADEKEEYVQKRLKKLERDIRDKLNITVDSEAEARILDFNYKKYENMRDINSELMKRISSELYPVLYRKYQN